MPKSTTAEEHQTKPNKGRSLWNNCLVIFKNANGMEDKDGGTVLGGKETREM